MNFYNYKEIKQIGNCLDFTKTDLNMKPVSGNDSFNIPWRPGSDSGALSINDRGWHDFVTKESGSIIDLCAKVKFGGDIIQSQEYLGKHYNLTPVNIKTKAVNQQTRFQTLLDKGYKVIRQYDYKKAGKCVHSVVRMEHATLKKEFVQRTPEGWGTKNIDPILFNYDNIIKSEYVIIVEGEKDAEKLISIGLVATTVCGGSKKWRAEYNEDIRDKNTVILPDNDAPGNEHALSIAQQLKGIATDVKIVKTSDKAKGDVSDYLLDHSKDELIKLIKDTPKLTSKSTELFTKEVAKKANQYDFCNYTIIKKTDEKGKEKDKKIPKPLNQLIKEVRSRFLGFPKRIGEDLFDYNRDTKKIQYIYNVSEFFAWMQAKSNRCTDWAKFDSAVSKSELFSALKADSKIFEGFSYVPDLPPQPYIYYLPVDMPEPHPDHKYFEDFILHFNPATTEDLIMLKTLFAAPLCSNVSKPLWVIDSIKAQESGKSTIAFMLAELYGLTLESKSVLSIDYEEIKNNESELKKRLVSSAASQKRIVLIDNVEGLFKSPFLAGLTTANTISGRPAYGRGETTIRNRFNYIITANSAMLDTDLISRSFFINIAASNKSKHWKSAVLHDIAENRFRILADIQDIVNNNSTEYPTATRFPEFEAKILAPMCDDFNQYESVFKHLVEQKTSADHSTDQCNIIEDKILTELRLLGLNPEINNIFIRSTVFALWFPHFKTYPTQIIKNHIKKDKFAYLSLKRERDNYARRGLFWRANDDDKSYKIIDIKGEKVALI